MNHNSAVSFVDLCNKCPRDGTAALDYCDTPKSGKSLQIILKLVILVVLEGALRAQSGEGVGWDQVKRTDQPTGQYK